MMTALTSTVPESHLDEITRDDHTIWIEPHAQARKIPQDECGVLGMVDTQTAALGQTMYYGLYALQHRGQESAGIAAFDHDQLRLHKDMGLVNQVFPAHVLDNLTGQIAIGHTRYSTTGGSTLDNAQPVIARTTQGAVALAHNGNLINIQELRTALTGQGYQFFGDSDTHLMAHLIRYGLQQPLHQVVERPELALTLPSQPVHSAAHLESIQTAAQLSPLHGAVMQMLALSQGAFSVVIATGDTLIAARDPYGLRPLCYGVTPNGSPVVASESCALDIMGAKFVRDIAPGEVFTMTLNGMTHTQFLPGVEQNPKPESFCFFELVYFARPDSKYKGASIHTYRRSLGQKLAERSAEIFGEKAQADMVISVPDSGTIAAGGYSQASGIPFVEGLVKNRYVGRTFINPTPELRERSIQLKLNPLTDVLQGKSVVVVDDSIVRGNTSRKLVKMLRDVGVREVHMRISSAMVQNPCFYGIDMSTPDQLLARQMTLEEMRDWIGVDTLLFMTVEDMQAVGKSGQFCMACFDNVYPAGTPRTRQDALQSSGSSVQGLTALEAKLVAAQQ